jgi:diguanylate cyclase
MKILIVDDDVVERESVKRALNRIQENVHLTEADSVDKALILCNSIQFDVILLDYRMPVRDGLELILELRNRGLDNDNIILMMSNSEDDDLALECIEAGAQDFLLKKDINTNRLRRTILQASKRRELEQELRQSFVQLKKLAERDPLTGLANRHMFEESFKIELANNARTDSYLSLMVFDIDDFKLINDNFGHLAGDQILVKLSNRVSSCLRGNELFARLGGDEFALVLSNQEEIHNSTSVANRISKVLQLPFTVDKHEIKMTVSIGISVTAELLIAPEEMLRQADIAMYRSKQKGRGNISFFEESMQKSAEQRLQIETGLTRALSHNEFQLVYQPIIRGEDLGLYGFEALLRWYAPEGLIPPFRFIPIAEQSNKMIDIGRWVIREAIIQASAWRKLGYANFSMSINLSATQFVDEMLPEYIIQLCREYDIDASSLELELTETALIGKPDKKLFFLRRLKDIGVKIALDDFGTGYSSVSHLKFFPIDTVKLDRSVLPRDDHEEWDLLLFTALAKMLETLNFTTVAEGVETVKQEALCRDMGITKLQGYYYSKPLAAASAELMLEKSVFIASEITDDTRPHLH